jgi:hypothetical protein
MRRLTKVLFPALGDPIMATLSNSESAGMSGRSSEIAVCSAKKTQINGVLLIVIQSMIFCIFKTYHSFVQLMVYLNRTLIKESRFHLDPNQYESPE